MKLRCLVLLVGPLLASSCGEDHKSLTPTEFSTQYAQDLCKAVSWACQIPEPTCTAGRLAARAALDQRAVLRGQTFVPANAENCLNQVNNVYGKTEQGAVALKASDVQGAEQACRDVYRGAKVANEACGEDEDCVMGLICDFSKGTATGRCGAKTEVAAGGGCANIGEVCPRGSFCGGSTGVFVCQAKMDLAWPCSDTVPCLETLRCAGGLCVAQLGLGELCAVDQDCSTGFCDPYAKRCAGDLRFANGTPSCQAFVAH